jgi:hypothetical protein
MTDFLDELVALCNSEAQFVSILASFLSTESTCINCPHGTCYSIGTVDKTKNVSMVRKLTVKNYFLSTLGKPTVSSSNSSSTKCRVHILVHRLMTGANQTEVVRHLCGCGSCCNRDHLKAGRQEENINDTHVHYVFKKLREVGQNELVESIKEALSTDLL